MIINTDGDIIAAFWDDEGVVQEYQSFKICLYFDDKQKEEYREMKQCLIDLSKTDYKATKYAEGLYTEEEYIPIKTERQHWRDRYNELSSAFIMPHLTDDEVKEVIEKYYDKHKQ